MAKSDSHLGGFAYAERYCEENAWHLAGDDRLPAGPRFVVVIANHEKSCPIWQQRCGAGPDDPVVWDYHVILAVVVDGVPRIWDLDSYVALGASLAEYLAASFPMHDLLIDRLQPCFRVVPAAEYRENLASDRSHMIADNGVWAAPPPPWSMIGTGHNLHQYWRTQGAGPGVFCETFEALEAALLG